MAGDVPIDMWYSHLPSAGFELAVGSLVWVGDTRYKVIRQEFREPSKEDIDEWGTTTVGMNIVDLTLVPA